MVNENPESPGIAKSSSRNETSLDGGSNLQGNNGITTWAMDRKRRKFQYKLQNYLNRNVTNNPHAEDTLLKNASNSIMEPIADGNSNEGKHRVLDGDDKHNDRLVGTFSKKNTLVQENISPHTHLTENSKMVNNDAEASLNTDINKGNDTCMESSCSQDIQEGDASPIIDVINIKHVEKVEANSVSEVAEKFNSLQDGADGDSRMELDTHATDVSLVEASSTQIDEKKEQRKVYNRKRKKAFKSRRKNLVSVEEDSSSSVLVENRAESKYFGHLNEALPSLCAGIMSERDDLAGCGTSLRTVEDNSEQSTSCWSSDGEPVFKTSKKNIELETSGKTIDDINLLKDVSLVGAPEENSEPSQRSIVDVFQNVEGNVCSVEDNNRECSKVRRDEASDDPNIHSSIKHLDQEKMKIQPKREDVNSHSQLGVTKEDVGAVAIKEHNPLPVLQSSPERALTSRRRKKLLILDVNGLLVDIVAFPYHRYKADTVIGGKSVFKRPFCDGFLQFCFEKFDVGVWTSRTKKNLDAVLAFLLGKSKSNLLFCWDQRHCTVTGHNTIENKEKPMLLKELKKIWEKHEADVPWEKGAYDESNTLLLDDSPYKAILNPPNTAVFPHPFGYMAVNDNALAPLGDLRIYLEKLSLAENVQEFVKRNPFGQRPISERNVSWRFYSKIIGAASSKQEGGTSRSSASRW